MSIRVRLTVVYTAILTGFFLCFGFLSYFVVRQTLLSAIDTSLEHTAHQIIGATEVFSTGDITLLSLPKDMDVFETATIFMMVVNQQGQVIAQSDNLRGFQSLLDESGRKLTEPNYNIVVHYGQKLRVYSYPLIVQQNNNQQIVGYLQVAQLMEGYDAALNTVFIALAVIGGVVFFFFLFLGAVTTHGLLRPLAEITAVALQISRADNLSRRIPDDGRRDEIGHLTLALNQTFERLEKLFRTQQRFLADVSHELRTPLTTVRGNIDLMRRMGEYDPDSLDIIGDELQRMTRLVGDLLLLARADGGSLPITRKPMDVDTIVFDVYRQIQPLQEARGVIVHLQGIMPIRIMGDSDRIKQLLLILVDNAIKYTPAGGGVYLSVQRQEHHACVSVRDTGPGIPTQHIPFIFERFYRVDKARSRAQGGSGLGLSIAKWIAEAHGGFIRVQSEEGQGSTFTVWLPALPDDPFLPAGGESEEHAVSAPPTMSQPRTV